MLSQKMKGTPQLLSHLAQRVRGLAFCDRKSVQKHVFGSFVKSNDRQFPTVRFDRKKKDSHRASIIITTDLVIAIPSYP
jgi:hypothetical protein